jgi:hypothetical protein
MYVLMEHGIESSCIINAGHTGTVVGFTSSRKVALSHILSGLKLDYTRYLKGVRSCVVAPDVLPEDTLAPIDVVWTVEYLKTVPDDDLRDLGEDVVPVAEKFILWWAKTRDQNGAIAARENVAIEEAIARLNEYVDIFNHHKRETSEGRYQSLGYYEHYGYLSSESMVEVNGVPCELKPGAGGWLVGNAAANVVPTENLPDLFVAVTQALCLKMKLAWERFITIDGVPLAHIQNEIERLYQHPYENRLFRLPEITRMAPDYKSGRLGFNWDEASSAAPPADRGNVIFIKGPRVKVFKQGSLGIER